MPSGKRPVEVLFVEDNAADFELMQLLTREFEASLRLHRKSDGEEALRFLCDEQSAPKLPDVVVLDLGLPRVSGQEVLRAIRQDPRCSNLPVIVWTTSNNERDRKECLALGANRFFTKPRNYEECERFARQLIDEEIPALTEV